MITKKSCFNTFLSTLFTGISLTFIALAGFATRNTLVFVPFLFAIINFCSYLFFKSNKHKFPYYFHIGLLFLLTNNNVGGNLSSKGIVSIGIGLTVLIACIVVVRRKIKGSPFFNQQSYTNYLYEKYKKLLEEDKLVVQRGAIHSGILFLLGWISYVVYGHRGYWLLLSGSAVLIGEDLGKIHVRGLRRIVGAGIGFLIAAIFVLTGSSKTGLIILYIAATVGAFMLMPQKYILGSACIGLQATAANAFIEGKMGFTILFERACWTIIGALITIALCYIADKLFKNLYCDYEKDSLIYHK